MRNGTPRISALKRALDMLEAVLADGGRSPLSALAGALGVPVATAHRQVTTLIDAGFLQRVAGGLVAGPRLLGLRAYLDDKQIATNIAGAHLHRLAARLGCTVQLGTWENDMVTYRLKSGHGAAELFTRVGMQLEAYCSGVGKVLLAALPDAELAAYLATGPFPALTARTITDAAALQGELLAVRRQGYATDDEEVVDGLRCVALPLRGGDGRTLAAISASWTIDEMPARLVENGLPPLQRAQQAIEAQMAEVFAGPVAALTGG